MLVSLSLKKKTLKCSGKIYPFLTEGSNHESVALIMSGLCRLFSISMSAALFLMLWQFMRMHRKFGLWSLLLFIGFLVIGCVVTTCSCFV